MPRQHAPVNQLFLNLFDSANNVARVHGVAAITLLQFVLLVECGGLW